MRKHKSQKLPVPTKAQVIKDAQSFKQVIIILADIALSSLREGELEDVERVLNGIKETGRITV